MLCISFSITNVELGDAKYKLYVVISRLMKGQKAV